MTMVPERRSTCWRSRAILSRRSGRRRFSNRFSGTLCHLVYRFLYGPLYRIPYANRDPMINREMTGVMVTNSPVLRRLGLPAEVRARHALLRYALVSFAPVQSSAKRFSRPAGWAHSLTATELCEEARELTIASFVCLAKS